MELHEEILIIMDMDYEKLEKKSETKQLEIYNKTLDDIFDLCIKEGMKQWVKN